MNIPKGYILLTAIDNSVDREHRKTLQSLKSIESVQVGSAEHAKIGGAAIIQTHMGGLLVSESMDEVIDRMNEATLKDI